MPEPGPQFFCIPHVAELLHARDGRAARRLAARVQRVELVLFRDVDDREQVARGTDVHRLDDAEHRGGRDGCIDCVAALLQDVEARLRRQRLTRRDDAVARDDLRAMLGQPALRAIAGNSAAERRLRRRVARLHRRLRRGEVDEEQGCGDCQCLVVHPCIVSPLRLPEPVTIPYGRPILRRMNKRHKLWIGAGVAVVVVAVALQVLRGRRSALRLLRPRSEKMRSLPRWRRSSRRSVRDRSSP